MKLAGPAATRFLEQPDRSRAAILLHGPDAMRISLKRKALVDALTGPKADEEMRLNRLDAAAIRKDPATLIDAIKAVGFFPGQRVVLVEGAADGSTKAFKAALMDWQQGDAIVVAVAGQLAARSSLRKLFDGAQSAVSIGIYNDPPRQDEIEAQLAKAGLTSVSPEAMRGLISMGQALDPGDFAQTVEKLSLYKLSDDTPVSPEDVANCAPLTTDAALDDVIRDAADGRADRIGPQMARLAGQGVNPTTLCIGATRHFRQLHAAASSNMGIDAALSRARPPVFGPRRDQMARQASSWGSARLEKALEVLMETDLMLRSSHLAPVFAVVERAFIRIAMLRPK